MFYIPNTVIPDHQQTNITLHEQQEIQSMAYTMLWTQSQMNHWLYRGSMTSSKQTYILYSAWYPLQSHQKKSRKQYGVLRGQWTIDDCLHDDSLSILSQIFLIFPSISSPLDAVFFGGIIDPWIHKGPITVVFQSLYSYTVMQRQQTISKASYMDCLAAQPSAFGSPCCRQEDAY